MSGDDPNLPSLRHIADALGDLRESVVFVGGAIAGLLISDPLAAGVRATRDVDAIVDAGRAMFRTIEKRVANSGFIRDMNSNVICRWLHKETGVIFDLMPVDPEVLGFSNRWYPYAVQTSIAVEVDPGMTVRLASPVAFVATKLAAFASRGKGDFLSSHDLEDVLNIVDGREELADEMAAAPAELRREIAAAFARLISNDDFLNALPGLISEPERAHLIQSRLRKLGME